VREVGKRGKMKNLSRVFEFIYFLIAEQKCNCAIIMWCPKNPWGARRSSLVGAWDNYSLRMQDTIMADIHTGQFLLHHSFHLHPE